MTREEIIDFCDMKAHLEPEKRGHFFSNNQSTRARVKNKSVRP